MGYECGYDQMLMCVQPQAHKKQADLHSVEAVAGGNKHDIISFVLLHS